MASPPQSIRRQLSLYVSPGAAVEIEAVRRVLDPVQSCLIPAHVTLCREDELGQLTAADLEARLSDSRLRPITLVFGRPEVFAGHGILMNCIGGEDEFRRLRAHLLGAGPLGNQPPHLTLAHPRNPRSDGNDLGNAAGLPERMTITFPVVSLIEQAGQAPWRLLRAFRLPGRPPERA